MTMRLPCTLITLSDLFHHVSQVAHDLLTPSTSHALLSVAAPTLVATERELIGRALPSTRRDTSDVDGEHLRRPSALQGRGGNH